MTHRTDRIRAALTAGFAPLALEVADDSHSHAGHSGAAPGGETHFNVMMESGSFIGMSRVARSRAVHAALTAEFSTGLHALSLTLRAPSEAT